MDSTQETEWKPNAEALSMLVDMGISKIAAEHALYYTGNTSVEAAASYVFDNLEADQMIPVPAEHVKTSTSTHATNPVRHENIAKDDEDEEEIGNYKMVFVVNVGLKMGVGKIAAQVAHACLGLYKDVLEDRSMEEPLDEWLTEGSKKVVLKGENHIQLQELEKKAKVNSVHSHLIHDAGRTQIPANSVTVLALFGEETRVDMITGGLGLL